MSRPLLRLFVRAAGVVAAVTLTGRLPAQPPRPETPQARAEALAGEIHGILEPRAVATITDAEIAGLPPEGKPVVLTWERAYALAVVHARSGKPFPGATFDPKILDQEAARLGLADFARFRKEFLAQGETFRDPSGDVLDLLVRLAEVENARGNVSGYEMFRATLAELIKGESSGLNQLQLDQVDSRLQEARRAYLDALTRLRDRLDAVKLALGLAPEVPLVPDRTALAAFRDVFEAVDTWLRNPRRQLSDLPLLAMRLPSPRDMVIDGRPILGPTDRPTAPLDDLLTAAVRVAARNHGNPTADTGHALLIRSRVRHLVDLHRAYELERRQFVLTVRMHDEAFERLLAPPRGDPAAPRPTASSILEARARVLGVRNRLVALWASSQSERMMLSRDLRELPFHDWKSFHAQLAAVPTPVHTPVNPAPAAAASLPIPAPPPPPAPPAPPQPPGPRS